MNLFERTFSGKTVLVTGHTGFKGSWLSAWLTKLGAKVVGLSCDIPTTPSNFEASEIGHLVDDLRIDIRNLKDVKNIMQQYPPDFVFHLAAQALVRTSYDDPLGTIATNSLGSANVLEALRYLDKHVVAIMITSDKAYDNVEWVWGYRETDRLGGKDPYSASKGMAELAIRTYVESFFNQSDNRIRVGITRAGNVIGGGDWARDRIVPDCMRAWSENKTVDIRSPDATRPWQHVLEPLSGYLTLAVELDRRSDLHGEAFNFGPSAEQNHSVRELIDAMAAHWENVRWNDVSRKRGHVHEAGLLKLNCDKALYNLSWQPTLRFEDTVEMTVEWYKAFYRGGAASMRDFTLAQIEEYMQLATDRKTDWAMG